MKWKRKSSGRCRGEEVRERLIRQDPDGGGRCKGGAGGGCVPRGCVAVMLVGGEAETEERVVVDVRALGQPRVRALLDMAALEFGYDQKGVLRIPCTADEFRRAVAADSNRPGWR